MKTVFGFSLFLLSIGGAFAQTMAPYYCNNGKYGLANEDGKLIVPCNYESITHRPRQGVYLTEKEGKFGLADMETGRLICDAFFPKIPGGADVYVKELQGEKYAYLDTLSRFGSGQHYMVFSNKGTMEPIACFHGSHSTKRFASQSVFSSNIEYVHDIWRYKSPDGGVNFYHKTKKKLLENDVVNGIILTKDRLAIEGENGLIALCDLSGKNLTDYEFMDIYRIDDNTFAVNATVSDWYVSKKNYPSKAGIIDKSGQLLIDTIYRRLQSFGEAFMMVEKDETYGIIDRNNDFIFPLTEDKFKPASPGKIISHDQRSIIDLSTKKTFETEGSINYLSHIDVYSIQKNQGVYTMLDAELNEIFTGKANYIQKAVRENTFKITGKEGIGYLVREDRTVVEVEADELAVEQVGTQGAIIRARKDTLFGLIDENFNVLFETIYQRPRMYREGKENFFLIKLHDEPLYAWYDFKGEPVNRRPVADPQFVRNGSGYREIRDGKGNTKFLFRDGSFREKPAYRITGSHTTPSGKILFVNPPEKGGKRYYVLDEYLYNIIPEGFYIPNKYFKAKSLKTGLITVFDDFTSGVINDNGDWEIKPSEHGYQVISANLISKYNGEPNRYSQGGVDCLVKKNGAWESVGNYYNIPKNLNKGWLAVSQKGENAGDVKMALLDSTGTIRLPAIYSKIYLGQEHIIAQIVNKKDTTAITEVYDLKGKLLLSTPYYGKKIPGFDFLIIKDLTNNLEGLMDMAGKVIVEPKYVELSYFSQSNCIEYQVGEYPNRQKVVASLDGKILMQSKHIRREFMEMEGKSRMALQGEGPLKLYDEKLELMGENNLKFKDGNRLTPNYFRCITADNKYIYVSLKTGKTLKE